MLYLPLRERVEVRLSREGLVLYARDGGWGGRVYRLSGDCPALGARNCGAAAPSRGERQEGDQRWEESGWGVGGACAASLWGN